MENDLPPLSPKVQSEVSSFLADLVSRPPVIIEDADEREEDEYKHHQRLYDAYELLPHKPDECARVSMDVARKCNGCVDAVTHLTQLARLSPEKALPCYEWATKAGREFLGEEFFEDGDGRMWGDIEARPYLRALFGKGDTLHELGRHKEADACFAELLKLDKEDTFEVASRISTNPVLPRCSEIDELPGHSGQVKTNKPQGFGHQR